MKKSIKILGLACMAGVLAFMTSCKKDETNSSIRVTIPSYDIEDSERAYVDMYTNKVTWQDGDALYVFNINPDDYTKSKVAYYVALGCEGQATANFTTESPTLGASQGLGYSAFYPTYWRNAEDSEPYDEPVYGDPSLDNNRLTFATLPTQHYFVGNHLGYDMATLDPDAIRLVWGGETLDNGISMSHIFGLVKLELGGVVGHVDHIELIDPTQDASLCGTVSINMGTLVKQALEDLKQSMKDYRSTGDETIAADIREILVDQLGYMPEEKYSNMLTLDCAPYYPALDLNHNEFFYFGVRPGAFIDGMTVKIYFTDRETIEVVNPAPKGNQYVKNFMTVPAGLRKYEINLDQY